MVSLISTLTKMTVLWIPTAKSAASSSWFVKILVLALTYMEPMKNMYHLVLAVCTLNLLMGFWKNHKLNNEHWNGKKAWKTIEKVAIFTVYVTFIYFFETTILHSDSSKVLISDDLWASRIICGILILSEAKSISENGDAILNMKLFVPFYKKLVNLFDKKQPYDKN